MAFEKGDFVDTTGSVITDADLGAGTAIEVEVGRKLVDCAASVVTG